MRTIYPNKDGTIVEHDFEKSEEVVGYASDSQIHGVTDVLGRQAMTRKILWKIDTRYEPVCTFICLLDAYSFGHQDSPGSRPDVPVLVPRPDERRKCKALWP